MVLRIGLPTPSGGREQPDAVPLEHDEPDRRKQNGHTQQCPSTPTRNRTFGLIKALSSRNQCLRRARPHRWAKWGSPSEPIHTP
jgi:hypothetical protein